MNIKKTSLLSACSVLFGALMLPTSASAAPLVSVGDNVDVFFNGSSSLRWTSNIFRDEDNEVDDLVWTLTPGFDINIGRGLSNADLSIITRYDIIRYQDLDQLDVELFHIKAVGAYQSSRLDLNGSVSFDEAQTSTGDENQTNALIRTDNVGASLLGEYRVSPKFSFGAGIQYDEREYANDGEYYEDNFADRETIKLPFDVFYELTPKIDLSLGYTYSHAEIGATSYRAFKGSAVIRERSGRDTETHFMNIGARGQLLPKLNGYLKIGYKFRDNDDYTSESFFPASPLRTIGGSSNGTLGIDSRFTWTATPKITANMSLSRDFGVGGEGVGVENSSVNTSVNYSLDAYWSARADAGYTLRDYDQDGRKDHQYKLGASLSYVPNQYWRFTGGYNYIENDSNITNRSYTNHMLNVTVGLRY